MHKLSKRSTVVLAGVAVAVIAGGAAFAAAGWTINGTGKASGKAAEVKDLTATSTFASNLYPGVKVNLSTKIKNPNEFKVVLDGSVGITNATVTPADANATSCQNAIKTAGIFTTDFPGTPEIPPISADFDLPASVTVGDLPQSCAGKTIKIDYAIKGSSKA